MITIPLIIEETNLSTAWCRTVQHIVDNSGKEISPLVLTLTEFQESENVRRILDSSLFENQMDSVRTVSETIFPESLYKFCNNDRIEFFDQYIENLPRIKKIDPRNMRGTYFERLIAFDSNNRKINQLEIIISSLLNPIIKRRSKLQASIFNPSKDHTNGPYQGFPCLQHVTFYKSEHGGLVLNSFYAIQYLYRRGYGNWLGLINLGKFIAQESNLNLDRVNCFVGVEQLDKLTKAQAKELLEKINCNQ